jgi:hypothetical protein
MIGVGLAPASKADEVEIRRKSRSAGSLGAILEWLQHCFVEHMTPPFKYECDESWLTVNGKADLEGGAGRAARESASVYLLHQRTCCIPGGVNQGPTRSPFEKLACLIVVTNLLQSL